MGKINLLFVITQLELGGAQKQLLSLIKDINRQRFNIFLITAKRGILLDDALSIEGVKVNTSRWLQPAINPLKDVLALGTIYHFIRQNNIDIVHTHSSKAGIIGRWAGKLAGVGNIVHTVHGWSFHDYQNPFMYRFSVFLEILTGKITDKFIVVSNYDKEKGLSRHIGKSNNYQLIKYSINFEEFKKSPDSSIRNGIRKELGIKENTPLVGMVSCLKPQKSPLDYIRVAALVSKAHPEVKFILVGDGILRKKVEYLIERYSLKEKITLLGWRKDISALLSAMDIFVLTSLWEGLPVIVLEALISQKPVVITDTGGVSEVVKQGTSGFLVAPGEVKSIAENIIELIKNKQLRTELEKNACEAVDSNFDIRTVLDQTQDLYGKLVNNRITKDVN